MDEKAQLKALESFLKQYGQYYPEEAIKFIKKNFLYENDTDIILQIRSKLNLIPPEQDIYQGFINNLKQYNLNRGDLLEVASGFYPILSERLTSEPNVNQVTAIDPQIIPCSSAKLKTQKCRFKLTDNTKKYNCLVALKPCEITIDIIQNAFKYHKPFSVGLCGCTHFTYISPFFIPTYERWEQHIEDTINANLEPNAEVYIDHLASSYHYPYKIFTKIYKK